MFYGNKIRDKNIQTHNSFISKVFKIKNISKQVCVDQNAPIQILAHFSE